MYLRSSCTVRNCLIAGNSAERYGSGGGVYLGSGSDYTISGCVIVGNAAAGKGGGILNSYSPSLIHNSMLYNNTASEGAQIYAIGPVIVTVTVAYCNVQGGKDGVQASSLESLVWGPGNTNAGPCFVRAGDYSEGIVGDYHLKSQAERWDSQSGMWLADAVSSPCIDAGNPGSPLGDEPESPSNRRINMGAYGGAAEASKTPAGWLIMWTPRRKTYSCSTKD